MKKLFLVCVLLILFSSLAFASYKAPCQNLHLDIATQNNLLNGDFGQEVCLSAIQTKSYWLKVQEPGKWVWVLHPCWQPKEENNLLNVYYCWRLVNGF